MKLSKQQREKDSLWNLVDKRDKYLKKAAIVQEQIDRARGNSGKPKQVYTNQEKKTYEAYDWHRRIH